jgi:cysteinyl-tRNA synthetase
VDAVLDRVRRPLRLGGTPLPVVGRARVYVCGITPYAVTHLGHAATYLWTDLAVRVWRSAGVDVEVARNITDVDEALFAEAARLDLPYDQIAALARFAFDRTMATLGVRLPDHEPTARAAVSQVVELGQALLDGGHAYLRGGTVYARTAEAAARAGVDRAEALRLAAEYHDDPDDPDRDDPLDVAIWRAGRPGGVGSGAHGDSDGGHGPGGPGHGHDVHAADLASRVSWPSPWGPGRPGWHAECAAMVLATFGSSVDLHAGGADLRFPHHAVESLLAERATGVAPFARAWLRAGTVRTGGAKMAKSAGNLVLVDDLLTRHTPAALRLLCLGRPWAQDWDFDESALDGVAATLDDVYAAAGRRGDSTLATAEVDAALLDDLDTPRALAVALDAGGSAARRLVTVLGLG